jgi:hypothetical protein
MKKIAQLPDNEKTFEISIEKGDNTGLTWKGKFRCRCVLNLRQKAEADVFEARLNSGLNLPETTKWFHFAIAQLTARLDAAPEWWIEANNGQDLLDLNVILEVFKQCMAAEKEWREQVWGPVKTDIVLKNTDTEAKEIEKTDAVNIPK